MAVGIPNSGNECFAISAMQCVFSCSLLREQFMRGSGEEGRIVAEILRGLERGTPVALTPLLRRLGWTGRQEDSVEFLERLIDVMRIQRPLGRVCGVWCGNAIFCDTCRVGTVPFTEETILRVPVTDPTLTRCLERFTSPTRLEETVCETCKKRKFQRFLPLRRLPRVVMIHPIFDKSRSATVDKLRCPKGSGFVLGKALGSEDTSTFRLRSTILHAGTASGGHYITLVRTAVSGGDHATGMHEEWLLLDDSRVVRLTGGAAYRHMRPYLLVYERD
jgi:ubiquitin C-terminal hydrolase